MLSDSCKWNSQSCTHIYIC